MSTLPRRIQDVLLFIWTHLNFRTFDQEVVSVSSESELETEIASTTPDQEVVSVSSESELETEIASTIPDTSSTYTPTIPDSDDEVELLL